MCGIVFLYNEKIDPQTQREKTLKSIDLLTHRGPDESGSWFKSPVAIGHRRLSILDVFGSQQPMLDPSGRYILTYNGEIYNYRKLRSELKNRWSFRTQGDTEVLLAGLITQGESFLKRLEGMWAFALWDSVGESLLLSRDRMGKKPLFYQASTNMISCASELPALAALRTSQWSEDFNSTADYLRYGYFLPGTTVYKDVQEVLPGHVLHWSPRAGVTQNAYWSLNIGHYSGTKKNARKILREKLIHAVETRMVADVEVGAFLSGGIDSSLIVGILCQELGIKPKTFTIGFTDDSYDERRFAKHVAEVHGTEHYEETLKSCDSDLFKKLILENVGQPFADSSLLPTYSVAKLASRHVKVVLSGDGADELFSGYQRYQGRALLRWYTRLPKLLQRNIEKTIRSLPEPMVHHSRSLLKKAYLFCDIIERQESETPYIAPTNYAKHHFAQLVPSIADKGHVPQSLPAEARSDSILEMMAADAVFYLPQDILTKVDRATMSQSLEARTPFLDSEVVELAFSMPRIWHRRGYSGKRMLQETFKDVVPPLIWRRRKQGFGVPINQWFRSEVGSDLRRLISKQDDLPFNKSIVLSMLDTHCSGQRDLGYKLWNIYVYLFWKEHIGCL